MSADVFETARDFSDFGWMHPNGLRGSDDSEGPIRQNRWDVFLKKLGFVPGP